MIIVDPNMLYAVESSAQPRIFIAFSASFSAIFTASSTVFGLAASIASLNDILSFYQAVSQKALYLLFQQLPLVFQKAQAMAP